MRTITVPHDLRAGFAHATLDLPPGTPMGGYIAREEPSTGTLDPLQVAALVLDDGEHELVLIGADVIAVDGNLVSRIADRAGIPDGRLLLAASHTHAGPRGIVSRLHPSAANEADEALRERFVDLCAEAIAEARKALEPATLAAGFAATTGAWTNRNDPAGPVDPRVQVLTARDGAGQLLGAVILFACHPTVLPAGNLRVSADLAGGIRRAIAAEIGAGPVLLTLTGVAGDTSTRHTRLGAGPEELDRLGRIAAEAAREAMQTAEVTSGGIRMARVSVTLPPARIGADMAAELAAAEAELRALQTAGAPSTAVRTAETRAQGALLRSRMGDLPPATIPLTAWRIGDDLALVGIPGEPFASLGAAIETQSPFARTWVVGYANGYAGYLPDRAAFAAGTYEALASPYGEDVGEIVVEGALEALRGLL